MSDVTYPFADAIRLHRAGRRAESESACRRFLAGHPDHPDALHLLGILCLQSNRLDEAVDVLRRAVRARPEGFPQAYNNLGVALEGRHQLVKAEWAYRAALDLDEGYADAHANLGNVLRKESRPAESAEAYRAALRLRPDDPVVHNGLGSACLECGQLAEAIAHYRRRVELLPDDPVAHSDLIFWLCHDPHTGPQELFDEHRRWGARFERPLAGSLRPHENDRDPDRPLRVGYVSCDFREHPVPRFLEAILANHDPGRVVPVCFSGVRTPDEVTRRLRSIVPEWRETAWVSDERLAELIRGDRIDVLVDLTGHMGGNRLLTFARRPAPVQVSYMGYPHSTGLDAIGWRITDEASDPLNTHKRGTGAESAETAPVPFLPEGHAERPYRLPGCAFCYRPADEGFAVSPLPALANGGNVTFGMLNRMAKVTPQAAAVWAEVLRAVAGSRLLVLAPGGEKNVPARGLFERAGIPSDRLILVPTCQRKAYLRLAERVDVLLDPFPYAGMTTTCDFLWMGVPTVTLAGETALARAGVTLLRAVGLPELIADSPEQYVRIAADLARDLPRLADLRAGLRDRMATSPLCDGRGLTAKLEAAYRAMWRAWCEPGEPETNLVGRAGAGDFTPGS